MTPEQHNKYLAWSHIGFGAFFCLIMVSFMVAFGIVISLGNPGPNGPPMFLMWFFWLFFALIYGALMIPSFVAGYGLLKQKRWAKTAAIVAGVVSAMSFPIGTAVCVYTFWFLFSEPGKVMFDRPRYELPLRRQAWIDYGAQREQKEPEYIPPSTPPDWR